MVDGHARGGRLPWHFGRVLLVRWIAQKQQQVLMPAPSPSHSPASSARARYHHTAVDTVDHVAPEQLALNAANLAVWAYTIANLPELLPRGNDPAPPDPRQSPAGAASGASVGVIAGAVVGSLVGVALIAALAYFGRQGKGPLGGCLGGRTDADGVYSMLAKTTAQAGSV